MRGLWKNCRVRLLVVEDDAAFGAALARGLELARRIVARHGGSLELSSTPLGSDVSTPAARVRLPRRKVFARNRR